MGITLMHRVRHLGVTLALFGVGFYAALLPWHTVSQATLALAGSESGVTIEAPCHEAAAADSEKSKTSKPATPKTHCPICSGFAALQFALANPGIAAVLPPEAGGVVAGVAQDNLTTAVVLAPQSRGPPYLSSRT